MLVPDVKNAMAVAGPPPVIVPVLAVAWVVQVDKIPELLRQSWVTPPVPVTPTRTLPATSKVAVGPVVPMPTRLLAASIEKVLVSK